EVGFVRSLQARAAGDDLRGPLLSRRRRDLPSFVEHAAEETRGLAAAGEGQAEDAVHVAARGLLEVGEGAASMRVGKRAVVMASSRMTTRSATDEARLLDAVEEELHRERGEKDADHARDHREAG